MIPAEQGRGNKPSGGQAYGNAEYNAVQKSACSSGKLGTVHDVGASRMPVNCSAGSLYQLEPSPPVHP